MTRLVHAFICWYLRRRCGLAFHHGAYGSGSYVVLMNEHQYNRHTWSLQ